MAPPFPQRRGPPALPDPGAGGALLHHREQRVADLRQQVNVLVAVDEIRRPPEGLAERLDLALRFHGGERGRRARRASPRRERMPQRSGMRRPPRPDDRRTQRPERRREGEVQAEGGACGISGEPRHRARSPRRLRKLGAVDHHRGGIDAARRSGRGWRGSPPARCRSRRRIARISARMPPAPCRVGRWTKFGAPGLRPRSHSAALRAASSAAPPPSARA